MDIKAIKDIDGNFDFSITNGDLTKDNSFDTAIYMSLYTDARSDEIIQPERRSGWLGNIASKIEGRQLGSLLWTVNQRKLIPDTVNLSVNYAKLALDWIVQDGLAKSIIVEGNIIPKLGIQLTIKITHDAGIITTHYIKLWELTGGN